jgi:hypothetical protein
VVIKQQQSMKILVSISVLFLIGFLAACTAETAESTPILPPPNIDSVTSESSIENGGDTAVNPTLEPGQIAAATAVTQTPTAGEPTPTLDPTATVTTTPAATPATNPPVQAIQSGQLPPTSRDLLFLADGAFKRWSHSSGQIETLLPGPIPGARVRNEDNTFADFVGDITQFSVSQDGKRAVAVRLTASETVTRTVLETGNQYADK